MKDYASASSLYAKDIKRLINDIVHIPDFNADDVDKDILEQFANFIDGGDSKIISMHQEGDAAQKLELFKRPAEKVLRELKSDTRLAGYQPSLQVFNVLSYGQVKGNFLCPCNLH